MATQSESLQTTASATGGGWTSRYIADNGDGLADSDPRAQTHGGTGERTAGMSDIDANEPLSFSLPVLRAMLWRQRILLASVVAAALLIGLLATILQKPLYQAQADLRIDPIGLNVVEGQDLNPEIASNEYGRYLNTLSAELRSRKRSLEVVDTAGLANDPDMLAMHDAALPNGLGEGQREELMRARAAQYARQALEVVIPGDSRVMSLSVTGANPRLVSRIANAYAASLVDSDARRAIESNDYAKQVLDDRIAEVRSELEDAERATIAYARRNNLVGEAPQTMSASNTTQENGTGMAAAPEQTIAASNLFAINQQYNEARAERIRAEQRWNAARDTAAASLPEVQDSPAIQGLGARKAELQAQMADLRQRYLPSHPQIRELNAQIGTLDGQIGSLAANIKQSARAEYLVAAGRERAFRAELAAVSQATLSDQERRVRYGIIDRDAEALRAQLGTLLARSNELTSAAQVKTQNISLLEPAVPPAEPFSPDAIKNLLTALVVGLGLAVLLALAREAIDDKIRSPRDAERKLAMPLLGFTPWSQSDPFDELKSRHSVLSEAYASIRTTIDNAVVRQETLVVQLTSSQPGEGKSTTAIALADSYHRTGRRTLLIDADLRRPALHKYFGVASPEHGFVDTLLGNAALPDVVIEAPDIGLDFLALGKPPPNPVELLSSNLVQSFLAKYSDTYDVIVLDGSPVMGLADAPLLSHVADATLFIVEANRAHFGQAKAAVKRMRDAGAPLLGVVVTKYRAKEAGESYDYQYRYYSYGDQPAEQR